MSAVLFQDNYLFMCLLFHRCASALRGIISHRASRGQYRSWAALVAPVYDAVAVSCLPSLNKALITRWPESN